MIKNNLSQNFFRGNSISDISRLIKAGKIESKDLKNLSLELIKELNPKYRAFVEYDEQKSYENQIYDLKKSSFRYPNSSLNGIPFAVKDIFNTSLFRTQMGHQGWKDFRPGNNARVVDSILWRGGSLVGKTDTAELAVHNPGTSKNPHNQMHTPGTSSSGSAVAVATGMVPFALGTQSAGSIIRPASYCGVWGMKPSFGLIPRTGILKTADTLDTIGFFASHGSDLSLILDAIRVSGPDYPIVHRNLMAKKYYEKEPIKVGVVRTHTYDLSDDFMKTAFENFVNKLSKISEIVIHDLIWPQEFSETHLVHDAIYSKSLAYYLGKFNWSDLNSDILQEQITKGKAISLETYISALDRQNYFIKKIDDFLSSYDMVITTGVAGTAPLVGVDEKPDSSLVWTLAHVPSVHVPIGIHDDGLPFGFQFVGSRLSDYRLLSAIERFIELGILQNICAPF